MFCTVELGNTEQGGNAEQKTSKVWGLVSTLPLTFLMV
jgi:hypothetical protein